MTDDQLLALRTLADPDDRRLGQDDRDAIDAALAEIDRLRAEREALLELLIVRDHTLRQWSALGRRCRTRRAALAAVLAAAGISDPGGSATTRPSSESSKFRKCKLGEGRTDDPGACRPVRGRKGTPMRSAATKLCKRCGVRLAAVPDRRRASLTFQREVCQECHSQELGQDLEAIARRAADRAKEHQ